MATHRKQKPAPNPEGNALRFIEHGERSYASRIPASTWESLKPVLNSLNDAGKTRAEMRQVLIDSYNVAPSINQLNLKLGEWGFSPASRVFKASTRQRSTGIDGTEGMHTPDLLPTPTSLAYTKDTAVRTTPGTTNGSIKTSYLLRTRDNEGNVLAESIAKSFYNRKLVSYNVIEEISSYLCLIGLQAAAFDGYQRCYDMLKHLEPKAGRPLVHLAIQCLHTATQENQISSLWALIGDIEELIDDLGIAQIMCHCSIRQLLDIMNTRKWITSASVALLRKLEAKNDTVQGLSCYGDSCHLPYHRRDELEEESRKHWNIQYLAEWCISKTEELVVEAPYTFCRSRVHKDEHAMILVRELVHLWLQRQPGCRFLFHDLCSCRREIKPALFAIMTVAHHIFSRMKSLWLGMTDESLTPDQIRISTIWQDSLLLYRVELMENLTQKYVSLNTRGILMYEPEGITSSVYQNDKIEKHARQTILMIGGANLFEQCLNSALFKYEVIISHQPAPKALSSFEETVTDFERPRKTSSNSSARVRMSSASSSLYSASIRSGESPSMGEFRHTSHVARRMLSQLNRQATSTDIPDTPLSILVRNQDSVDFPDILGSVDEFFSEEDDDMDIDYEEREIQAGVLCSQTST